jgi:hypothetical protein
MHISLRGGIEIVKVAAKERTSRAEMKTKQSYCSKSDKEE